MYSEPWLLHLKYCPEKRLVYLPHCGKLTNLNKQALVTKSQKSRMRKISFYIT